MVDKDTKKIITLTLYPLSILNTSKVFLFNFDWIDNYIFVTIIIMKVQIPILIIYNNKDIWLSYLVYTLPSIICETIVASIFGYTNNILL